MSFNYVVQKLEEGKHPGEGWEPFGVSTKIKKVKTRVVDKKRKHTVTYIHWRKKFEE